MTSIETRLRALEGGKTLASGPGSGGGTGSGGSAPGFTLGVVPVSLGGTNLTQTGTADQVLKTNHAGTALEYGSVKAGSGIAVAADDTGITVTNTNAGGVATAVPPAWVSTTAYLAGNIVVGSDLNLYICVLGNTNNDPTPGQRHQLGPVLRVGEHDSERGRFRRKVQLARYGDQTGLGLCRQCSRPSRGNRNAQVRGWDLQL